MREFLLKLLGPENVLGGSESLAPYSEDFTEIEPSRPDLVAFATTTEQVQAIVREAGRLGVRLTPRVFGTNIGGLALASEGGIILDLTRMNRVLEVDPDDMVAVIEPGVTQRLLKDYLTARNLPLTFGFSLAPPDTSVFANALLGGLTNRSLKYGDQSLSISGLEVVRHDGSLARTGAWAVKGIPPYGRVPLPDLTGLFVGWAGTTGIATKMAFQLWPRHPVRRRLFYLTYTAKDTYDVMLRLCRAEMCEDIGGLSWPSAKMMLGIPRPDPVLGPGEPAFFLYVELAADTQDEIEARQKLLDVVFAELTGRGSPFDGPLDIEMLLKVNPKLAKFAEFPTDLEFLTNHGGGGLTWVGTYGPVSRFAVAADAATAVMVRHGLPPVIVSRPMRGGHYGVIRFITTFDKGVPAETARARAVNEELLGTLTDLGFVMYKTPAWAWERLKHRLDPGLVQLMQEVKKLMDPQRIFNPGKLGL
jgi:glycolate oxidase